MRPFHSWTTEVDTPVARSERYFKTDSQTCILKITRGIRRWWFRLLVCFSDQGYGFFGLLLGIPLNQDGKWLHAWETRCNHLWSANYRLQYWAELLRRPANRGRVPALLLSATGEEGKPAQPLTRLAFPITVLESSALPTCWSRPCCIIDYF